MMTKDEALKMAIEYLTNIQLDYKGHEVRKACQEALEQPNGSDLTYEELVSQRNYFQDLAGKYATELHELQEQPAQEPVAWMKSAIDNARDVCKYLDHDMVEEAKGHTEFFWNDLDKIREFDDTHPAASWQGLTDDEIRKVYFELYDSGLPTMCFAHAIEQALKEKNNV